VSGLNVLHTLVPQWLQWACYHSMVKIWNEFPELWDIRHVMYMCGIYRQAQLIYLGHTRTPNPLIALVGDSFRKLLSPCWNSRGLLHLSAELYCRLGIIRICSWIVLIVSVISWISSVPKVNASSHSNTKELCPFFHIGLQKGPFEWLADNYCCTKILLKVSYLSISLGIQAHKLLECLLEFDSLF